MDIFEKMGITIPWRAVKGHIGTRVCNFLRIPDQDGIHIHKQQIESNKKAKPMCKLIAATPDLLERDIKYLQKLEDERKQLELCGMDKAVGGIRMALDSFDFTPDKVATGMSWDDLKGED